MNVECVQRIANFVRDARGQKCERLNAFTFDSLKCFLARLGRVVQNQRNAGPAHRFAIERRGVEPEKSRTWIMDFKFVARDVRAAVVIRSGNFRPIHFRQNVRDPQIFRVRLQTDKPRDGLIKIKHTTIFVRHQHTVLDGVEKRFKKTAFAREPLNDSLQPFRVEPSNTAKHFVKKTGFGCSHW